MSTKRHLGSPTQARMAISRHASFWLVDAREIHSGDASTNEKIPPTFTGWRELFLSVRRTLRPPGRRVLTLGLTRYKINTPHTTGWPGGRYVLSVRRTLWPPGRRVLTLGLTKQKNKHPPYHWVAQWEICLIHTSDAVATREASPQNLTGGQTA